MLAGIVLYPVLQIYTLRQTSGWLYYASLVPLVLMACVYAYTVFALLMQSNLWPLFLIFTSPVAMMYVAVVWLFIAVSRYR